MLMEFTEAAHAQAAQVNPLRRQILRRQNRVLQNGHALTYAGLFVFTAVLFFRPYEIIPALAGLSSPVALIIALFTMAVFLPSQWLLEGRLTTRPPEVNLVLLLCLAALLSMPLSISPGESWANFNDTFIKAVFIFIVMVNVVRTERRLQGLLFIALGVGCMLSTSAINNYRLGNFTVEGYRVEGGVIQGALNDPNIMALFLVTVTPIAVALLLSTRHAFAKALYGLCAVALVAGNVVTYSRGGFLGLVCVAIVLAWKFGRRKPHLVVAGALICTVAFFALAPGNYGGRLASILNPSLDAVSSASHRRELLFQSTLVALRRPLFGVGMGNFNIVSLYGLETHNSYTQVASEMGMPALVLYASFIIVPLLGLRRIERETFGVQSCSRSYYLAVGLQASLAGYMVSSFFLSVAYQWYIYYLVAYAVCLRRIYETGPGKTLALDAGETVARQAGGHSRAITVAEREESEQEEREEPERVERQEAGRRY